MPRRILQGTVVSTANAKTITVSLERRGMPPVQKKTVRRNKKYHAHDPHDRAQLGETVRIRECAPISRTKRWELLSEADVAVPPPVVDTPVEEPVNTTEGDAT